jgi:hypothetical protein
VIQKPIRFIDIPIQSRNEEDAGFSRASSIKDQSFHSYHLHSEDPKVLLDHEQDEQNSSLNLTLPHNEKAISLT